MIEDMAVLHITEAELARDLQAVLEKVAALLGEAGGAERGDVVVDESAALRQGNYTVAGLRV